MNKNFIHLCVVIVESCWLDHELAVTLTTIMLKPDNKLQTGNLNLQS